MRDWTGCVFQRNKRGPWSAKWREFGAPIGGWKVTRGFRTKDEAQDFLTEKRRDYRQHRRGEHDPTAEHRHRPIAEHVAAFRAHLAAGRAGEKHVAVTARRLEDLLTRMKARTLADVTLSKGEGALALLTTEGFAAKTVDDYRAVLAQFGRWLDADQRVPKNPFAMLRRVYDARGREKHRQALAWDQVRQLAAAAVQRVLQRAPAKTREAHLVVARRRALIVTVAGLTGMRHNELAHLIWGWIDAGARSITVPAEVAKNGRSRRVPLHRGLAELLQQERERRALELGRPVAGSDLVLGELVHGEPQLPRHLVDRMRDDARWCAMQTRDEVGRVLDLHALRGSLGTTLRALGAHMDDVADVLGHAPRTVTGQHYVQAPFDRMLATIDLVPAEAAEVAGLWTPRATPNQLRADESVRGDPRQTGAG